MIEERTRIARELHDVVAHHISSIAIQAETARLTTPGLPELAPSASPRSATRPAAALDEMRRLLGRHARHRWRGRTGAATRARPDRPLVDETRVARHDVRFTVRGDVVALSEDVELVAYRIAQEALTNARRHAPGAAVDVALEYGPDALTLRGT